MKTRTWLMVVSAVTLTGCSVATTVRQNTRAAPQRFLIGLERPARRWRSGSVPTGRRAHRERADSHDVRDARA